MSSSSSTVAPWLLIALLFGPKKTATIQGFQKASLPGEVVTDSLRSTSAVSKFSYHIEAVMTSTYQFCSSILSGGVIGPVSSTLDMVGEVVWVVASIELVSCSTGWSPSSGSIPLKLVELVWGHWLVAPGLTLPKPLMMSYLVNMTCSFTLSLNSMTLLTKGQKSGLSVGLSFSTQYCNPTA